MAANAAEKVRGLMPQLLALFGVVAVLLVPLFWSL